jgi:DNA-binding NarL/FixJ family response regulator
MNNPARHCANCPVKLPVQAQKSLLLIDDHPIVQEVLAAMLRSVFIGANVCTADTLEQGIAQAQFARPDLVFLDLGLPGCTGIEALRRLRSSLPDVPVVVISAMDEREVVVRAMDAGAIGYIPKSSKPSVMTAALQLICAGGTYVPAEALEPATANGRQVLTERQFDVLRLIAKGFANKEIAQQLRIANDTVKQHAKAIYSALGVATRAKAARAAERHGIKLD